MPSGREPTGSPVSWLATTFVVLGGLLSCAFITITFSDDPLRVFTILAGVVCGCGALCWLLRDRSPTRPTRWWHRRPAKVQYRAVLKRPATADIPPPQPPTAERVREIAEDNNLWVPSQHRSEQSKRV